VGGAGLWCGGLSQRFCERALTARFILCSNVFCQDSAMKRFLLLPASLLLAAFSADQDAARQAVQAGRFKPLAAILAAVQARYPGRLD